MISQWKLLRFFSYMLFWLTGMMAGVCIQYLHPTEYTTVDLVITVPIYLGASVMAVAYSRASDELRAEKLSEEGGSK